MLHLGAKITLQFYVSTQIDNRSLPRTAKAAAAKSANEQSDQNAYLNVHCAYVAYYHT